MIITDFAKRYAEAWCSQNPQSVAAFFAENGSLTVNDGPSHRIILLILSKRMPAFEYVTALDRSSMP
jgi:hypothetical protein